MLRSRTVTVRTNLLDPLQNEELVQLAHILLDFLREMGGLAHLGVVGEAPVLQKPLEELKDLLKDRIGARQSLDNLQHQFLNANPNQLLLVDLVRVVIDLAIHQRLQDV